ncbi:hypothetical protein D3C87_345940 [compost metagenome]
MILKKIMFAMVVLFSLAGCGSGDDNATTPGNNTPVVINLTNISKGELSGDPITVGNFVIKDMEDWNTFKEEANITTDLVVDFSVHEVIAVVDKVYPSSGHSIEITSIKKVDNKLTVEIKKTETDSGLTVMTQPFHVVRIDKTGLPVVFKVNAPI